MARNTKAIGDTTVAMVLAALLRNGERVLLPFSDNERYDLVIDDGGRFDRVQCKTGKLKNGSIIFSSRSVYSHKKGCAVVKDYAGQVEFFGVYCPQNDGVYLVPILDVARGSGCLKVQQNGKYHNQHRFRWAVDYEIRSGGREA